MRRNRLIALATFSAAGLLASTSQAAIITSLTDNFDGGTIDPGKWVQTDRGLEQNAAAGYDPATITAGQLVLGGTTSNQYWFGRSLESVDTFSTLAETTFTVDRISLTGTGTAWRSSIWLLSDASHYLHFSQIRQENNGWTFNVNDGAGDPDTLTPTGGGTEIPSLDFLDGDVGNVSMRLKWVPSGTSGAGSITLSLIKGGVETIGTTRTVNNWGPDFRIILTGQARSGITPNTDNVSAVFDNVTVTTVPEPGTVALLGLAAGGLLVRRKRAAAR